MFSILFFIIYFYLSNNRPASRRISIGKRINSLLSTGLIPRFFSSRRMLNAICTCRLNSSFIVRLAKIIRKCHCMSLVKNSTTCLIISIKSFIVKQPCLFLPQPYNRSADKVLLVCFLNKLFVLVFGSSHIFFPYISFLVSERESKSAALPIRLINC